MPEANHPVTKPMNFLFLWQLIWTVPSRNYKWEKVLDNTITQSSLASNPKTEFF